MRYLVACIFALGAVFVVGNVDFASELVMEAEEKAARPERAREYHRELLCDCLKLHRGQNLRLHIAHQRDRELCHAKCIYEGGAVTKGTL